MVVVPGIGSFCCDLRLKCVPGDGRVVEQIIEPECVGERAATACDARLHGADGDVEDVGDLVVVQISDVAQDDGGLEVVAEITERLIDGEAIGNGIDPLGCHRIHDLGWATITVIIVVGANRVERGPTLAFAEFVERGVGCDAIRPGTELGSTIEPTDAAGDLDQGFLAGVVSVACAAGDSAADGKDPVVVASEQLIEGVAISTLGGCNQFVVR